MNNSASDEQLYSDFVHGNNEALDELLVRHKEGLVWFIFGIVKDLNDAEDLMMDTFALLIAKKPRFNNISSFKTWLYGIGRNLARTHVRKKQLASDKVDEMIPQVYREVIEGNDVLAKFIEAEDNSHIYEAFNRLTKDYMTVLYLQYIENLNINQVAKVMKKTVKQVYNLNARAKVQMKKELEIIKGKD